MHLGAKRAYFYAAASCDVYDESPMESQPGGEEHRSGKLMEAMNGARDPGQHLQKNCSDTVRELVLVAGKAPPCRLLHADWQVSALVHRDDGDFVGTTRHLARISEHTAWKYNIKLSRWPQRNRRIGQCRVC